MSWSETCWWSPPSGRGSGVSGCRTAPQRTINGPKRCRGQELSEAGAKGQGQLIKWPFPPFPKWPLESKWERKMGREVLRSRSIQSRFLHVPEKCYTKKIKKRKYWGKHKIAYASNEHFTKKMAIYPLGAETFWRERKHCLHLPSLWIFTYMQKLFA